MARARLKVGDITLREMIQISYDYYKRSEGDNKRWRAGVDVLNARLTIRRNMVYNRTKKIWEQVGREVKIIFEVRTDPKSYKKNDTVRIHKFPVTFIIKKFEKGLSSPFKWRTGSFKKPVLPKAGLKKEERQRLIDQNIKNGIQLQFFFELEYVLDKYNLLYGPNVTNGKPPRITNPNMIPFFDKHAFFVVSNLLVPMLTTKKRIIENALSKNPKRE